MKKKLIILLLIVHFLKELVWLAVIPIWHFPDEEQHFAPVAFWAEKSRRPEGKDINKEIDLSSEILETKRDERGVNEFTYRPEYKILYTKNQIGLYEEEIKELNTEENRKTMIKHEAARYGDVYYLLANIPYKIFYKSDLFVRVFASRFVSVILSTLTVLVTYLIAKEIFKKELLRLTLTFLVAFQPMFSFVSAGVNSDNLFNLIFSLILYFCLKLLINEKLKLRYLILLIVSLVLGFETKKQIAIALPIILLGLAIFLFKRKNKIKKYHLLMVFLTIALFGFLYSSTQGKIKIPEYDPDFIGESKLKESLFQYFFWHLKHTVAETIPWYWGVFNWLGVTLPAWVNRVQARILIVSTIGILVYFIKQIKNKKLFDKKNLKIVFLFSSAAIYYLAVIVWDYFFRKGHGFSFCMQGRYFFPTIVSHMLFIVLGLVTLIPKNLKTVFLKIFNSWWLIFSLIGLHTATTAYYQLWPISTFLNQASQYKPVVFKAVGLILVFFSFSLTTLFFLLNFLKLSFRSRK